MTHQEAIDRLKAIAHHGKDIYLVPKDQNALAMAVEALQAILDKQPKPVEKIAGRITTGRHV